MDVDRGDERRRIGGPTSVAPSESVVLYVEDLAAAATTDRDPSPEFYNRAADAYALSVEPDYRRASLYPPSPDSGSGFQLDDRSALYPTNFLSGERSCCPASVPRRSRSNLDVDQRSSRRSSVQSSRSRTSSCGRPTPLGRRQLRRKW